METTIAAAADSSVRQLPSLIMRAGPTLFALGAGDVREMVSTPEVRSVPNVPSFVRGVINLRGSVMPIVDLRHRLGMVTGAAEAAQLADLLGARLQDHRRWVDELTASVAERRPFTLTTDPHACAFGRWYDTFRTDNVILDLALKRFDAPHKRIHAVGEKVTQLMADKRYDRCEELVADVRDTVLTSLVHSFEQAIAAVREITREIAVVVQHPGTQAYALAVDAIESVERLRDDSVTGMEDVLGSTSPHELVCGVARRTRDGHLVLLLRPESLL